MAHLLNDLKNVARRAGVSERDAKRLLTEIRLFVLENGEFRLPHIGVLRTKVHGPRVFAGLHGRKNVPSRRTLHFRSSPAFRKALNSPFRQAKAANP